MAQSRLAAAVQCAPKHSERRAAAAAFNSAHGPQRDFRRSNSTAGPGRSLRARERKAPEPSILGAACISQQGSINVSQLSTDPGHPEMQAVLAVPPREAARLLSLSTTKIYQLLRNGELDSFSDGKARRIIVASIYGYIARRRTASGDGWRSWQHNPRSRRPKRQQSRERG